MISRVVLLLLLAAGSLVDFAKSNSLNLVVRHNYPVEQHKLTTSDGYILTIFRIPYSLSDGETQGQGKPVVFLQHGITGSSDDWLLNGPKSGLAYLLADAGFDVWLGNSRGNSNGRENQKLKPSNEKFWKFSWHEIGAYDLPAQIDYVLRITNQAALHFIGHSQGGTAYLVMLAEHPEYNEKISTTNLLAPLAFCSNMESKLMTLVLKVNEYMVDGEYSQSSLTNHPLSNVFCSTLIGKHLCHDMLFTLIGGNSPHINKTLVPQLEKTTSSGFSNMLLKHYAQVFKTGRFAKYDYGNATNLEVYGTSKPPLYDLSNVAPTDMVHMFYSDNDQLLSVEDAERLGQRINAIQNHVEVKNWNHLDYVYATDVVQVIYEQLIQSIRDYKPNLI
ncbi:lipase 3-like [Drosophila obscura]|uniref:lipase 3-like n=1 Tax=Drosophila obscura TaxID=7282 RepID=UPI000BA0D721|nr:lipase 3-like [Drosophila obscura]